MAKVPLTQVLRALDKKDRDFYDNIDPKDLQLYPLLRFMSSVKGATLSQEWHILATNQNVNRYFWELGKYPKLQWLLLTTVSPKIGIQYHEWISTKKKNNDDDKVIKFLKSIYETAKDDEIRILAKIYTRADIERIAKEQGWDDKRITREL